MPRNTSKTDRLNARPLEVHTHSFVSGLRANGGCYSPRGVWLLSTFSHSHADGDRAHQHPNTGPASYTIDKDEWARATGLRGGGRKTFTAKPTGEQLPRVELKAWQTSFEVIVVVPRQSENGAGPGIAPAVRMIQQFGMTANVKEVE